MLTLTSILPNTTNHYYTISWQAVELSPLLQRDMSQTNCTHWRRWTRCVCWQSICIYKLDKIIFKPLPVFVQTRLHSGCPMIVWRQVASHQLMCTITLRLKGIPATTCSWFLNVKKLIVINHQFFLAANRLLFYSGVTKPGVAT